MNEYFIILGSQISWDALTAIGTCLGVLFSGGLSVLIIIQARNLNKKQIKLQESINEQQVILQKNQLRADIFPYKRELFLNFIKVQNFSKNLMESFFIQTLEKMTIKELYNAYVIISEQYLGDVKATMGSLSESRYLLPNDLSSEVLEINKVLNRTCISFEVLHSLENVFTNTNMEEKKMEEILEEQKQFSLDNIYKNCKIINSKSKFLIAKIEKELNISDIDK